jgi:cardiolipin synthase C
MNSHKNQQLMLCLCAMTVITMVRPANASAAFVRILNSQSAAFHARSELIDSACCSIDIATYSLHSDSSSRLLLEKILEARRRNVRVRILVDGIMNDLSHHMFTRLTEAGVCIREFHPLGLFPKRFPGFRSHIKMMVVDGVTMITGGRNMGDAYFMTGSGENFVDRDVMVAECPAVACAGCCFNKIWTHDLSRDTRRPTCLNRCRQFFASFRRTCGTDCLQCRCAVLKQKTYCPCDTLTDVAPDSVRFVHSSPSAEKHCSDITTSLLSLVRSARHRIVIETPYVTLSKEFRGVLEAKVESGIPVMLVTNSLRSTNHVVAHTGYMSQKRKLRRLGIQIFEYTGPGTLHAKNWVVDGSVFIGSYNLNSRSRLYDCECGLIIHDAQLAVSTLRCMSKHELKRCRCCDEDCLSRHDLTHAGLRPLELLLMQPALPLISPHI